MICYAFELMGVLLEFVSFRVSSHGDRIAS